VEWVRGAVVRHAIDLRRRSHRKGPHAPRATDCVKFALRAGREVALPSAEVNVLVSGELIGRVMAQTWKRVKPPSDSDPVAVTSSGTKRSCGEDYTGRSLEWWRRKALRGAYPVLREGECQVGNRSI
jgi:hypothetical protein